MKKSIIAGFVNESKIRGRKCPPVIEVGRQEPDAQPCPSLLQVSFAAAFWVNKWTLQASLSQRSPNQTKPGRSR